MDLDFAHRLTAQSTLAEMPAWSEFLDLSQPGEVLGDLFKAQPDLPGVVVLEHGEVLGALSRGQYLRVIGRHLGLELYHSRPARRIFESVEHDDRPLVLSQQTQIQDAVRQALLRPRALLYEPLIVESTTETDGPRLALIDFQDLLRADSRVSALRNRQMSQILSTVQEGFLLVDRGHRIAAEYSKSLETIFGVESADQIAGRRFGHLLADRLDAERAELGSDYLDTLFDPNVIESLIVQINPLMRVQARMPDGSVRHLEFRFRRSLEELGGRDFIDRVLVRVEDVSRQVQMAAELEAQEKKAERRVAVVFDLVQADSSSVAGFLDHLDAGLDEAERLVASDALRRQEDLHAVFRRIHGLKGEAGLIGLQTFQTQLHRFEDGLAALRQGQSAGHSGDRSALHQALADLRALTGETTQLLGTFQRMAGSAPPSRSEPGTGSDSGADAGTDSPILPAVARMVDEMADRVGKPARFLSHVLEADLPDAYRDLLRQVLIQLARNSLVHGVESPEERRRLGKPTVATLQLALYAHAATRQLEFVFQDDGAGLDLDAIRRRAIEEGLVLDESKPETAVIESIFHSGFSTFANDADDSTLDAGRGVGLDLVRDLVTEQGGQVIPHTRRGEFCAFQVLLPDPEPDVATSLVTETSLTAVSA